MNKGRARASDASQAKRERREQRKAAEAAAARKTRRRRLVLRVAAGTVAAAALTGIGYLVFRPAPEVQGVERPQNQGRSHVETEQIQYDDEAPTSGDHLAAAPACGVAPSQLDPGLAVHALEHGAVVVWYDPSRDGLADSLADRLDDWESHWILSPNEEIGDPIVATAWNRRMAFAEPEATQLREFVETYRQRGPERVECPV